MNDRQMLIRAALETLRQGESLLQELSDELYTRRFPVAFNASVGGHYRHCLDHFRGLLESHPGGALNYDHRERDTLIEADRFAALNATRALCEELERLAEDSLDRELAVTCRTSYCSAGSQVARSSVGRELMYAVAHAVHHYALIGIMGGLAGVKLPAGFGVAPSTLRHQAAQAAAA